MDGMWMICGWYVVGMWMVCGRYVADMWTVYSSESTPLLRFTVEGGVV